MQVIAQATFAAVAQSSIITAMTQNTDLLTPTSVCTAWVCYWTEKNSHGSKSILNGPFTFNMYDFVSNLIKKEVLTTRLFERVYDCHPMGSLRRAVNHLRAAVTELVGLHHRHPGPVGEVNVVLKQADAERVRDGSTSVDHCFPDKSI